MTTYTLRNAPDGDYLLRLPDGTSYHVTVFVGHVSGGHPVRWVTGYCPDNVDLLLRNPDVVLEWIGAPTTPTLPPKSSAPRLDRQTAVACARLVCWGCANVGDPVPDSNLPGRFRHYPIEGHSGIDCVASPIWKNIGDSP